MASVFISHRGADTSEATRLATAIRKAGHKVWLDEWEIGLGDSIVERINQGLEAATHVILCLSSSGVDSPWINVEWMSTLARKLNGAGVKLLPVRLTGGGPPAILADVKYADLVADWDRGLAAILKALG